MVVGQETESIGIPALADQPAGRFGAEPEETELEDGGNTLEGGWNPPRPGGVDLEGTERAPSGNDRACVPQGVVEGTQRGAVGGIGQFDDQHGGATRGEGETRPDEEASTNEHPDTLRGGLDDRSYNLLSVNSQRSVC